MVLVRLSLWCFKEGKREEAFLGLDHILNTTTRNSEGFRGYMSLLSYEDPNSATILTLWQDEKSLKASEKEVFAQAIEKVKDSIEKPPALQNLSIFSSVFPIEGEIRSLGETPKFVFLKK